MQAQSLQWSQFTTQNEFREGATWTMAIEKEQGGAIYGFSIGTADNVAPTFPTTDIEYYGNFKPGSQQYSYLSKYSADGSTLEWVRVFTGGDNAASGNGAFRPTEMELSPTGEIVCIFEGVGVGAAPELITPDAQHPNAPPFNTNGDVTPIIAKFDTNGDLLYGSYLFDAGLGRVRSLAQYGATTFGQHLEIGADGTVYWDGYFQRNDGQPMNFPTSPNALATSLDQAPTPNGVTPQATYFTIINPDNTTRFATWIDVANVNNSGSVIDTRVAPNGDLYMILLNYTTESVVGVDVPANAYVPSVDLSVANQVIRFDANGNVLGSTFLPIISDFNPTAAALTLRPNGNVIATQGGGQVFELSPDLTTLVQTANPFGINASEGAFQTYTDVELDDYGRIHFTAVRSLVVKPTTPGALSSASDPGRPKAYYGILDCNLELVYGTEMTFGEKSNAALNNQENYLFELEVEGCNAYMSGFVRGSNEYPVTPTAFSNDGTQVLSGYDITPMGRSSNAASVHRNGVLMAFNYPVMETGTNTITTPAVTNFCLNSVALPIEGTPTNYITPEVLGPADDSPAPTPTYYQWQIGTSATGPWTDIADSNVETLVPEASATAGTYFYRRLVRQTPYGQGLCVPGCDIENESNVISLTFSDDITHATDIPEGVYGICAGSTTINLNVNITISPDGESGPYDYKLTTQNDLETTIFGIQGQVANSSTPIALSVGEAGDYILQVTDSRGCVSFDTLVIENLALNIESDSKFTCGEATIEIGPSSLPLDYINFPTNSFLWSPATGLSNPNAVRPTFTHGLTVGDSTMKYLSFNGCLVDSIEIFNDVVDPLPVLPTIELCQGETAKLGTDLSVDTSLIITESGVTYEWAPGLGLVDDTDVNTNVTSAGAPAGVNVRNYTLLATTGNTGCVATTTQQVIIYRQPNQSFESNRCLANGCDNSLTLMAGPYGTDPEPGISYSWTATVEDDPGNVGNTGVPTDAEALSWIVYPDSSHLIVNAGTPGNGYAAQYGYTITYVRTSFNTADPSCMRTDTARLDYCCGSGPACDLALGNVPTVFCGGVENDIGPADVRIDGRYYWSRLDGSPLNNELFDAVTGDTLSGTGPHPAKVHADPSGNVAVDYVLTFIYENPTVGDTCNIDIRVFPAAISTPSIDYTSPQAVCQGVEYTILGDPEQPALDYAWSPSEAFATLADTSKGLPTVAGLSTDTELYVQVTDPSTGCFALDTVQLVITPVAVNAGADDTFCDQGATVDIGANQATPGYTYQWTAVPPTGVSFGDNTAAMTTATLPATTAGQTIILYLEATNGLTAANCQLVDSVIYTASSSPTIGFPPITTLCSGGQITIGPITPNDPNNTYTWSGPSIVSGQGTSSIVVDDIGSYSVTVTQGTCTSNASITVSAPTEPTVDLAPAVPCAGDVTIGINNLTDTEKREWAFSWDNYTNLIANESDFSTITVRPTIATTYTLTATHTSGCVRTYAVNVPAAAYAADLPTTLNFCEGDDTTLPLNDFSSVSGSVVWTADPASATSYLSSTTASQPTIDISAAPAGQYTYTATVSYTGGCTSSASTTVNIGKALENIAGFDKEICEGECVELGTSRVSGISYQWSADPADATLVSTNFNQPTVCPTQNTVYTLTYTDLAGCTHTDEVAVQVNNSPTLVVQDIKACQNATGTATVDLNTAIVSNDGTTTTFWQDERALVAANNPVSGSTTYYIKSENNEGCSTILPVEVVIYENPIGTVTASYTCGADGVLTIASSAAGGRYDYSVGANYIGNTTYVTATPISGGVALVTGLPVGFPNQDYTVRLFGADSTCTTDITVNIVQNASPDVAAFAIQPSCVNGVALSNGYLQISEANNADRYHWSVGSTFDDDGGTDTYTNATALGSFPDTIAMNLPNPSGSQDYTIRVYNTSNECFRDVVVRMNEQDCAFSCECTEYLYVNDVDEDVTHKFRIDPTTGGVTEIGSPWLDNPDVFFQHGIGQDVNGNIYIADSFRDGPFNRIDAFGNLMDNDVFSAENRSIVSNIVIENNVLYAIRETEPVIFAYDVCTGMKIGEMNWAPTGPATTNAWGLFTTNDGNWYIASREGPPMIYSGSLDISLYTEPATNSGTPLFMPVNPVTGTGGLDINVMGMTRDMDGNFYIIENQTGTGNNADLIVAKYAPDGTFLKQVQADNTFAANTTNGQLGFSGARAIVYSGSSNKLYLGSFDNCVTVLDTALNELSALNIGNPQQGSPKAIGIVKECCPTNNNVTIDTTLCAASINDELFLQDIISCAGPIAEGTWQAGNANTGLSYDTCHNRITITAQNACGTFTLSSTGVNNNAQCGAFTITVNIEVGSITAPVFTLESNQTVCVGGDPAAFTVATPASGSNTITYQWQSSTDSITFTDILSATDSTYNPPAGITDTTYYRVITAVGGGCSSGNCYDTAYVVVRTVPCDWGDLPDVTNATGMDDYQTLRANDGPVHQIIDGLSLGMAIDGELDGIPSNNALGDGVDEDGLTMFASLNLVPDLTFRLPFNYVNTTGNTAHVEAWIDWNADGAFNGVDEMVLDWNDGAGALPDIVEITIPQSAITGRQLGWRIRISNQDNMTPYGFQPNGEVEDYLIGIDCAQICLPINVSVLRK
ncbi:MAG: GEVED domain-containing protein [Bacteroidota bacterium]